MFNRAVTLIELIAVVIIMIILAVIIVPNITNASNQAKHAALVQNLQELQNATDQFYMEKGVYPTFQGTSVSSQPSKDGVQAYPINIYADPNGQVFYPNFVRSKPSTNGSIFGMPSDISYGVTYTGVVFIATGPSSKWSSDTTVYTTSKPNGEPVSNLNVTSLSGIGSITNLYSASTGVNGSGGYIYEWNGGDLSWDKIGFIPNSDGIIGGLSFDAHDDQLITMTNMNTSGPSYSYTLTLGSNNSSQITKYPPSSSFITPRRITGRNTGLASISYDEQYYSNNNAIYYYLNNNWHEIKDPSSVTNESSFEGGIFNYTYDTNNNSFYGVDQSGVIWQYNLQGDSWAQVSSGYTGYSINYDKYTDKLVLTGNGSDVYQMNPTNESVTVLPPIPSVYGAVDPVFSKGGSIYAIEDNTSKNVIYKWNGTSWASISVPTRSDSFINITYDNQYNYLIASTYTGIFVWNGSKWTSTNAPINDYYVLSVN